MEEYKKYTQYKFTETLITTVLMLFVVASVFIIGKTINPEEKYSKISNSSIITITQL